MTATAAARGTRTSFLFSAIAPLVLIGALVAVFLAVDPIAPLRPTAPVESLAFERTTFEPGRIELRVRNDGPDPVTIAQVLVNEAYWDFRATDSTLGRLESATLDVLYPWEAGLPVTFGIVTSSGVVIEHEVEAAARTPEPDLSVFMIYALLGVYIGVIPVTVGLLWFPALARASAAWVAFFLAFTVGLLAFLLIDTIEEGLEAASAAGGALNGVGLFAVGALGAIMALLALELWLQRRERAPVGGLVLAYLVAVGIGLHNLGEGLAVGAALAAGEIALGTFLVVGFALHNTTEGLAIVAPLGRDRRRPALWHFALLGATAGAPTIAGAWLGGFAFSPASGALAFGIAAGAIAQVVWTIGRHIGRDEESRSPLTALGFVTGLVVMYVTGLLVV